MSGSIFIKLKKKKIPKYCDDGNRNFDNAIIRIDQDSKTNTSVTDQLKHLQDLYNSGVISGYEYENEKKKLLIK